MLQVRKIIFEQNIVVSDQVNLKFEQKIDSAARNHGGRERGYLYLMVIA